MSVLDLRMLQEHAYALINPLQVDVEAWKDLPTLPVVPEPFRSQPALFPVLLDLHQLDATTRMELLQRAEEWDRTDEYPFFSALLNTVAPAEQVQQHLENCMALRDPAGHMDVIRIHDPRTFRHLRWILEQEQMSALLGPVATWSWREPSGQWDKYERVSTTSMPFNLSSPQKDKLMRLGELNVCLRKLSRIAPELNDDAALAMRLDALLAEAWQQHQLSEKEDRRLYAVQGALFPPDIHQHPQLRARLGKVRAEAVSYVGLCAELDDQAMQRMATELRTHKDLV